MSIRPRDWRIAYTLLLPTLIALLMVRDATRDPSASVATTTAVTADATATLGRNGPTELRDALIALAVETLLVCVILRPWSYQRRSRRSIVAVALALPWTVVQAQGIRSAGGVVQLHLFWLVVLDALLLLLVLLRFARRGDEE